MPPARRRIWTIGSPRRQWTFTTSQLVWKSIVVAVCLLGALTLAYSVYLVYTVSKSNQELSLVATAENRYMEKNWQEKERAKRILLFANESYSKRAGKYVGGTAEDGSKPEWAQREMRILREPYPIDSEVEHLLGKADRQAQETNGAHWVWHRSRWEQPKGWPTNGIAEKPWPRVEEKLLETWFDSRGELAALLIARKEIDGSDSWEYIGRTIGDWRMSR